MTPRTCPAFYPIGMRGALHRTEPELNTFVKRYLNPEIWWLKYRSEALAAKGEIYSIVIVGEINPKPTYSEASGKYRGHITLMLRSEVQPGQWTYPITILFNGGCANRKPKSLIEIPVETGLRHEFFPDMVRAAVGTRKYLLAKPSHRLAVADFLDRFFVND